MSSALGSKLKTSAKEFQTVEITMDKKVIEQAKEVT
jgi:hypothetical protein